jgi:hypothetical protein
LVAPFSIPPRTRRVLSFSRVFLQQIHHTESVGRCQAAETGVKNCIFFRDFLYFGAKELRIAEFFAILRNGDGKEPADAPE